LTKRYTEIDIAKGVAILLVVIGHLTQGFVPLGHEWFVQIKRYIYDFHMPLFMFLSGFVYQLVAEKKLRSEGAVKFIAHSARRLLPGWLLIGLIIISLKMAIGSSLSVNNQVEPGISAFIKMLYLPGDSGARSLWYVHTLLMLYVLFSIVGYYMRRMNKLFFVASMIMTIVAAYVPLMSVMGLKQVAFYGGFFALGGLAYKNWEYFRVLCRKWLWLWVLIFAISLYLDIPGWYARKAVGGLFSIPVMIGLVSYFGPRLRSFFEYIGRYTFTIYLLNTLVIGATIVLFKKIGIFGGWGFYLYVFVAITLGSWGCIFIHNLLQRITPPIAKYFK